MELKNKKTGETGYYLHTHRDYKSGNIKVAVLKNGVTNQFMTIILSQNSC